MSVALYGPDLHLPADSQCSVWKGRTAG